MGNIENFWKKYFRLNTDKETPHMIMPSLYETLYDHFYMNQIFFNHAHLWLTE